MISCLGAPFRYISEEIDMEWYNQYLRTRTNSVRCAIVKTGDEEKILGLISLLSINNINRSAELHIMIGSEKDRGKGLGFFAVKEILNHAFNNLNLQRIELAVLKSNYPAQKLYNKVGFVQEGVKRKAVYKNGKYEDLLIMSILKEEYVRL